MENKQKKIIVLVAILVIIVAAVITFILLFNKPNNGTQNNTNNPSNNPSQSGENNNSNNNGTSGSNDNENPTEDNNVTDNNNDNNSNQSSNNSSSSTTTPVTKKLRIYSCRRTTTDSGVEIVDSLSLRYHIENGLQSDEVIVTLKVLNSAGNSTLEAYKKWMTQLKALAGVSVTTTQSGDKTVFDIKTDYTKVDYSGIDFEDKNRVLFYNDIRANDSLETITTFLDAAGYTCQSPREE